jgi:hypothetical protein
MLDMGSQIDTQPIPQEQNKWAIENATDNAPVILNPIHIITNRFTLFFVKGDN